ncbi:MAG: HK97 gp10 family phage protein [Hyphomicrobiaceae bacterium]|nr:HK97 gp10 family phage protein [Hyphomicrobiaceae bacterium]MCC0024628.1 HK97 gp10 family phage protein [Hyphomicrobiaceae bacterium]
MKLEVEVDGLRELDAALGQLKQATARNVVRRVLTRAGAPIAEEAASLAPKDTGQLASSIIVTGKFNNRVGKAEYAAVMRSGGTRTEAVDALRAARRGAGSGVADVQVFIGPAKASSRDEGIKQVVQEFGSVKQGPNPYMRPAWDTKRFTALDIVKRDMAGEIDKAAKRAAARALKKAQAGGS